MAGFGERNEIVRIIERIDRLLGPSAKPRESLEEDVALERLTGRERDRNTMAHLLDTIVAHQR